jgi:rRNA processing protein Gar1
VNIEFLGFTLDVIGKVMIAYAAIKVHYRFWKERRVDEFVFKEMKREQIIGIAGIILIIIGFFLQIPSKL